ncbi:unnamed protein product [Cladocopium goreaui]|uniref:Kinase D-interacting substrate of 220 kDa n=1 Tax=Cladocopium goreaui TaxID=2562237 RepID=A0A9P1DG89_9DINO|nr:unnamed protein product [Cladocopium goreaui]
MAPSVNEAQRMIDELLWKAAQNNVPQVIEDLIQKHQANKNQVSPSGQTLLHQAAQNEQHALEVSQLLVKLGLKATDVDKHNQTSIFYAARDGNAELCEFLLQHGCMVNHMDTGLQTAIFYSARNGHMAATDVFLKRGANVEIKDKRGFTPIFWAAESGRVDTMKKLIQKGANTKHLSTIGGDLFTSATGEAMNFSVNELGAVLIETYGLDVNHQDENGQTCLYYAALYGGIVVTQKLILQFKADVLIRDKNGKTALAFLQQKPKIEQNPQILKLLSDATKKQHKALEEAQKKERAAAAREQKKREQEAKARKKAEDKARATAAAEARRARAEAGASRSSRTNKKRSASSGENPSKKRQKYHFVCYDTGQVVPRDSEKFKENYAELLEKCPFLKR